MKNSHKSMLLALTALTLLACTPTTPIQSPIVTQFKWGEIQVGSKTYVDCRLWPNHSEAWDWTKHNTHHRPGIQPADVADFASEVDEIVLSEGVDGVLQIKPETINALKKLGKIVHVARTPTAIDIYNNLAKQGKKVGALLHSTC